MMSPLCGRAHIGRCTDGPTYTRDDASVRLLELGYRFDEERADWWRPLLGFDGDGLPVDRGRLAWTPDYCHPDEVSSGTRFFLVRPHGGGEREVLP